MFDQIDHPTLGCIRGLPSKSQKTVQFRNIKFAEIPGRWQDPIMFSKRLSDDVFDATRFGPCCPQNAAGLNYDLGLVGNVKLEHDEILQSEFECLNIVITVPQIDKLIDSRALPVMVWVHGGGFSVGSNAFPQYDLQRLVEASVGLGKPVIGVAITYRVGIFGFLASDELGLDGNYGLRDQMCAFNWVRNHIAGFGGDPSQVMAFGESAGAISISTHLLSNTPLFTRAILMSGNTTLRSIRKRSWHNSFYDRNMKMLGLDNISPKERKLALYSMSIEELTNRLPMFQHWSPAIDGKFLVKEVNLGILGNVNDPTGKPCWCKEIVVGDTLHDVGSVLKGSVLDDPMAMKRLHDSMNSLLDANDRDKILQAYSLAGKPSPEESRAGLLALITDLRFYLPVHLVLKGWKHSKSDGAKPRAYRYHFHQLNPFNGHFKGLASHELDVAYLLQNFFEHMDARDCVLATRMTEIWINFAYGLGWPKRDGGDSVLVIGGLKELDLLDDDDYDLQFRSRRGQLMLDIGWEKCFKLGEMLQGCYSDEEETGFKSRL